MKKLLSAFLLAFVLILAACSSDEPEVKGESEKETPEVEEAPKQDRDEGEDKQDVEVDKDLLNVEVVIPESLWNVNLEHLKDEAAKKGIKDVTVNGDGSVTYKMSKSAHEKLLEESADESERIFAEIVEFSEPIKDVSANKSNTEFTITVDAAKFHKSVDGLVAFKISASGMYYQIIDGVNPGEYKVTVNFVDENGGTIDTVVFPDYYMNE